jgi:tetratricopeptide (TPR) repeat protein
VRAAMMASDFQASADFLGNPVSGGDATALAAVDDFARAFLAYEARAGQVLKAAAAHPGHGLLNLYAGAIFMLLESPGARQRARPMLARARAAPLNERERRTADFLAAWIDDDVERAMTLGEAVTDAWPRDLAMAKLVQYLAFGQGDAGRMLTSALAARAAAPEIAQAHGMAAFGYEECHRLADAERAAREALEMTPREPWAQHAIAHVMLTEGRIDEGARFMEAASATWDGLSSFMATHNWWHLALFYLSQGRAEAVLAAYDDHCWAGDKDYSQDQIGAVSLLARAEMAGIDVGDRWGEVAERIAARGLDTEQPFLALQYLYALVRAGRGEAPALLAAIRGRTATAVGPASGVWADVATPTAEGLAACLAGQYPEAIRELARALPRLAQIGGSHAQRDLFEQIWLAALMADGRWNDAREALEQRRAFDPDGAPLNLLLARACDALELPAEAAEARARAQTTVARCAA